MLSVPLRWISSAGKRDLPSPRARKSISSGHDIPLTDTHVDPTPVIHADASSDQRGNHNTPQSSTKKEPKTTADDEGTGKIVDYSI